MASEWFYTRDGNKVGPVSSAQLQALAKSGRLKPTDKVWKEGMAQWVAASTIKGLFPSRVEAVTAKRPSVATSTGPGTDKGRSNKGKKSRASDEEQESSEQRGGRGKAIALFAIAAVACVACLGGVIVAGAWYLNSGTPDKTLAENKEKPLANQVADKKKDAPPEQPKDKTAEKKEVPPEPTKDKVTEKKEGPPEPTKDKVTEKKEGPPEPTKDKVTEKEDTPPDFKVATFDFSKVDYTKGPEGQKLTEKSGEEKRQSPGQPMDNLVRIVEQGYYVEKLPPEEITRNARIFDASFSKRNPKAHKLFVKRKLALAAKKEPFVRPSQVRLRPDITDFRFADNTTDQEKAEAFTDLYGLGNYQLILCFWPRASPLITRGSRCSCAMVAQEESMS